MFFSGFDSGRKGMRCVQLLAIFYKIYKISAQPTITLSRSVLGKSKDVALFLFYGTILGYYPDNKFGLADIGATGVCPT